MGKLLPSLLEINVFLIILAEIRQLPIPSSVLPSSATTQINLDSSTQLSIGISTQQIPETSSVPDIFPSPASSDIVLPSSVSPGNLSIRLKCSTVHNF